jgi:hypothetical protein
MKITLQTACVSVGLAAFGYLAASAQADAWNKKTILKFNQPVQVPGHVLTPGTYVFQLADMSADRNVVQIFSEDKKGMEHLVTTTMAIPDYRVATPVKTEVTFEERHSNTPEAVHSWFYPGDNYGWQFLYAKGQTLRVAKNTPPTAPVTRASKAAATSSTASKAAATSSTASKAAVTNTPTSKPSVAPPEPKPQPVTLAQNRPPTTSAPQPPAAKPGELPKTASNLPLEVTIGLFLLAVGAGILRLGLRRAQG